jgi:uncharacterized protein
MMWSASDMILIAAIGLLGGSLGGLLGLGGSVFIIPALTICFGANQHLYQAAALVANVFVAVAATLRHRGRGTIRRDVVPIAVAAGSVMAIVGVLISNMIPAKPLMAFFGAFLCYCTFTELVALARRTPDHDPNSDRRLPGRLPLMIGGVGGFAAGLLGIGGGAIMVPLFRKVARLPVREAVACSAATMIGACVVGALAKNLTVHSLRDPAGEMLATADSLLLAALLSPAAMLGGNAGALLVYRLPLTLTRCVLALLLGFAGVRMILSGLGG